MKYKGTTKYLSDYNLTKTTKIAIFGHFRLIFVILRDTTLEVRVHVYTISLISFWLTYVRED